MFIALNENGNAWNGVTWGWNETRRFVSTSAAVRSLHEAGEDIDSCTIVEDVFQTDDHRLTV
jgi:hypothetical protein